MAALPTMRTALGLDEWGVQWAVNAYLVASAVAIVLGGEAADGFGAREWRLVAIAGLALFGAAGVTIALSGSQVASRFVERRRPAPLVAFGFFTRPPRVSLEAGWSCSSAGSFLWGPVSAALRDRPAARAFGLAS